MKRGKFRVLSLVLAALCLFGFTACEPAHKDPVEQHVHHFVNGFCTGCGIPDPNYQGGGGEQPPVGGDETFSYYEETELRPDKKVYVLNFSGETLGNDDLNTLSAMQGLFARKEVTFYIDGKYMTNGTNADQYYMNVAEEEYGVEKEEITLERAVELYKDAWSDMVADGTWGSKISLADGFKNKDGSYNAYSEAAPQKGYQTPGYIVYTKGTYSVNIASTLAGITGFLPVELGQTEKYRALGLVEKMDVTASTWSYRWLFDACMSELSPEGLIHQNYAINGLTNYYVRDYGVTYKYLYVYYDNNVTINENLKKQIHGFLEKNIPILGYAFSEDRDVALFSQYGQFLVPTDYSMNLTFHAAGAFRRADGFTQPNKDSDKPAEQGKHYVAFVVSDGDNAQYWQNTAIFSTVYMNATGRENDDFAVTWSITPSLADMMPLVLGAAYGGDVTTKNDYFCAPVSGQGYINAGNFYNAGEEYMNDFLSKFDVYLGRSGLNVATIIGAEGYSGGIFGTLDAYAGVEHLNGGIVYTGGRYFQGLHSGGVYWKNGKPFIVPRDSLWSTTPAYIAARINMYAKTATGTDVTSTDAYTVINVHPWSHNYADIRTICGMLADNVEVVSLDRIVNMMRTSVADKSDTKDHFVMPLSGSGNTITDDDLRSNPSSIPTNPLYNDFLLWCEDWSGGEYCSSDASAPEAYAPFKTNMRVTAKATKAPFTLPAVDDLWVSFYARADSTDPSASTSFSFKMTVGGTEKTIIARAVMKGVAGTGTPKVTGDGWQTFAFPVGQYFPDYKGKTASAVIEKTGDIAIKVDQFSVTDRFIVQGENTVCADPFMNEFEDGSTEDWMLGDQFKTSQYYHWAAYDRETLQPSGSLQIDSSDGGGDEKRNGNVNVWSAKCITLTEDNYTLSFKVRGKTKCKFSLYIDGQYIVLSDWEISSTVGEKNIDLGALCKEYGIDSLDGKQVTFLFEVRDSANDTNGVGEDCNLEYFRLKAN